MNARWQWTLSLVGFVAALVFLDAPGPALLLGAALGLLGANPDPKRAKQWQSQILAVSVVLLGTTLDFSAALRVGSSGILVTVCLLSGVFAAGFGLAKLFHIERELATLITAGTAICGGSAIAAMSAVLRPKDTSIAVAMGIVFLLNAVGLFLLPALGHAFELSQTNFGWWAALAIHDTSSVVGACLAYGTEALRVGTTVKLSRALWIVPLTAIAWWLENRRTGSATGGKKFSVPWFLPAFLVASALVSAVPALAEFRPTYVLLARKGFVAALFFVGLGISIPMLRQVSPRTLAFGVLLWIVTLVASFPVARILGNQ